MAEQQVTSLNLSIQLKELGVPQTSLFSWMKPHKSGNFNLIYGWEADKEAYAAFTVAELGELLFHFPYPITLITKQHPDRITAEVFFNLACEHGGVTPKRTALESKLRKEYPRYSAPVQTEADARAQLLVYLLQEGIIDMKKGSVQCNKS